MELAEVLKILDECVRTAWNAYGQLNLGDKRTIGQRLKGVLGKFILSGDFNLDTLFNDIYSDVKRMEELILEGLSNKEFERELVNHPTALKRINTYYEMVDSISASIPASTLLYLPPTSGSTAGEETNQSLSYLVETSSGRAKAAKDSLLLQDAELKVESIAAKYNNWSLSLETTSGTNSGLLTPRSFYYLLLLCHSKIQNVDHVMTRGYPADLSGTETMPDNIREHLSTSDYSWMGDSRIKTFVQQVADNQSKMKHEINKQVSCEIVVFDDAHYTIHPALNDDMIRIPALNIK